MRKNLFSVLGIFLFILFLPGILVAKNKKTRPVVSVSDLRIEQLSNPMGIDVKMPRLSWKITSDKQDVMQTSYHILVASSPEKLAEDKGDLWDSGVVSGEASMWIAYAGKALKSNDRCYWKVRVETTVGKSAWSETATWTMGLLGETAWRGRWIGWDAPMEGDVETMSSRLSARYLRKEFNVERPVKRATLHIIGLGLYEAYINGQKIGGDQVLVPAPTDYRRTVLYNTYDVTAELQQDANAVGVVLGNGRFYTMCQNYKTYKIANFGYPKLRMNLIVEYEGGGKDVIVSDETWKLTGDGPIRSNNEYDGEEYDARKELGDWTKPGYDDSAWNKVQRVGIPTGTPRAMMTPPMRVMDIITPISLKPLGEKYVLDMGLNMTGWVRMKVRGNSGDTIRLRFAERLNDDGTLYTANLRDARQTDVYICNGKEESEGRTWAPCFVTHGFRYVEVEGLDNASLADFVGEFVCDDMPTNGTFTCSSDVLNGVYKAAYWGIRGNYKGMPVDCPQRNERMPWLGDRTRGALGESYIFGNERLYSKWMDDIREAQREDGCIPDVAPAFWYYYTDDMTWPAAFVLISDMLYTQYGNMRPIEVNYPAMKRWMLHMKDTYTDRDGLVTKDKYADWCLPPEKLHMIHSQDPARKTSGALISSAYYIKMLQMMQRFAGLLGYDADCKQWKAWETDMKEAFNKRFLKVKEGTSPRPDHYLYPDSIFYDNNTATANLLPLAFDIVPEEYQMDVTRNMVARMTLPEKGFTMPRKAFIKSGVIGISWLMTELTRRGRGDVAYSLATQDEYPSWGYMVSQGATTIWELWNGDKADPAMNSGNHVMLLGDLITWCYAHAGGISSSDKPGETGYKRIVLRPDFSVPDLDHVDCSYETPYGKVGSRWKKTLMKLDWEVEIPCNTRAEVHFPDGTVKELGSGKYQFSVPLKNKLPGVVEESYLYEYASFPQCHSATIEENSKGDLVAAFFGGTKERHPDVCIYVCYKKKGETSWSAPQLVADGVFNEVNRKAFSQQDIADGLERKACWNPVLYQVPGGELLLFYKIGSSVADWTGWVIRSKNGGRTWSKPEALPEGFLGPIKNKPVMVEGGRIISPSSTEVGGWKLHFELSDDGGKTWRMVGPIPADMALRSQYIRPDGLSGDSTKLEPLVTIQPAILKLADGRLQALARTRNGFMATTYSEDNGETWSQVTLMKNLPQNNSGVDAVTLADGRHWLIYNNFFTIPSTEKGWRTPLDIAQSPDGQNWQHILCLEDAPIGQYSYPSIIQSSDGMIHAIYTWRRERVKYMKIDPQVFK